MITGVALALALAGCRWLYGPAVALPEDLDEVAAKPAVGARALLLLHQVDVELATWQPALEKPSARPWDHAAWRLSLGSSTSTRSSGSYRRSSAVRRIGRDPVSRKARCAWEVPGECVPFR